MIDTSSEISSLPILPSDDGKAGAVADGPAALQRQTTVNTDFTSKHLLLFVLARCPRFGWFL